MVDKYAMDTGISHCEGFERFFEMMERISTRGSCVTQCCGKPRESIFGECYPVEARLRELGIFNQFKLDSEVNAVGDEFIKYNSHKFFIAPCIEPCSK